MLGLAIAADLMDVTVAAMTVAVEVLACSAVTCAGMECELCSAWVVWGRAME